MEKAEENRRDSLFVITPALNEANGVSLLLQEVQRVMDSPATGYRLRVVLVDDGSADETSAKAVLTGRELHLELDVIRLSRNFGQQAAIHAGLEYAFNKATANSLFLILDSDLQHPPELIARMLPEIAAGFDHVQMCREEDRSLPFFKRTTSRAFYHLFGALSGTSLEPGSSDFRLFTWEYCKAYLSYEEVNRFNRAIFASLGFPTKRLTYAPAKRQMGDSKYSVGKMVKLGLKGLVQFTNAPLILCSLGTFLLSTVVCVGYAVLELTKFFQGVQFAVGWPTLIFFVFFWGGLLSLNQLVSSLYVASIYNEVKKRPIYIVESVQTVTQASMRHSG